jgi:hypothetical protein
MPSIRSLAGTVAFLTLGITVEIAMFRYCGESTPPEQEGPHTLAEVVKIVEEHGLYALSDRPDGKLINRVIVADHPMSRRQRCALRFGFPHHPCWHGVVAVSYPWRSYMVHYELEGDSSAIWGKMFLYGDREMIRRLTGRQE